MGMLDGKVAVVTGAGRGIGRSEALLLAKHGAKVVVNDYGGSLLGAGNDQQPAHDVAAEIVAAGGEAVADLGNVSNWSDAEGLIARAVDTFGRLDILVNNAGVIRTGMVFNASESDWDAVASVHMKGTFATSRFAAEHWRNLAKSTSQRQDAAIVNTSSPNGLNGGVPGHVNYATAKSGIATMTLTLARELEPYGVRCNAIGPVAVTRMTEELWETDMFAGERREEMSPEGIAAVVTWLASPLAKDVNGQVLGIHGRECRVWESWRVGSRVETPSGHWTIESLDAAAGELFAGRDRWIPTPPD